MPSDEQTYYNGCVLANNQEKVKVNKLSNVQQLPEISANCCVDDMTKTMNYQHQLCFL